MSGSTFTGLIGDKTTIALAICYELSVPEHAEAAFKRGVEIYLTSVAKFGNGIDQALAGLVNEIAVETTSLATRSRILGTWIPLDCGQIELIGE